MTVKTKPFYGLKSYSRFQKMITLLLIFCKKNKKVYMAKVSKYKKKANNILYDLFKEVLRVLLHQTIIVVPSGVFMPKIGALCQK